jgi:Tol biopolymer transport system component
MGEVYRAKDTRLGREVAVKILPEFLASEPERLRRFEQEARAVAALNHPNILAIHDIGGQGEGPNAVPFLVSELLEGETMRAVLESGALAQRKTIEYGVQIAQGLAAAHEKGIVHRDLKPENIFVTKDGRIKILDFGLAKQVEKPGALPTEVTLTSSQTAAGVVMGTASYMAPEQVRGEPADPRTDIFAFGAVLYEMLSGTRAFRRDTAVETMTAVLKHDPPELADRVHLVSPALERTVRRCLEKSPEERFQSARDLSFALSAFSGTESASIARASAAAPRRMRVLLGLVGVLALLVVAEATWWAGRRPVTTTRMQFAIPVPNEMSVSHMALSRDGTMLAFVSPEPSTGVPMLWAQRVGSSSITLLSGTQNASFPFWSPDGAYVAFFGGGKLQKMPVSGGSPQILATVLQARGGSWGSRNVIVYAPDSTSGLWRVNSDGSGLSPVTQDQLIADKEEQSHRWPEFLPDGEHFLYWAGNFSNSKDDHSSGIYLGSLNDKEKTLVALCHSSFGYDSRRLYYADAQRQLVSLAFDPATGRSSGSPIPNADTVGFQPSTYWAALAVSENGTVIYNTGVGAAASVLTWMDRSGKEVSRIGEPGIMANPTLSPDGSRVAVDIADVKANNVDIWIEGANGVGNARFTFDPGEEVAAIWSRDGSTIAYRSVTPAGVVILTKKANGLEREKRIPSGKPIDDFIPSSWSLDGQQILCTEQSPSHSFLVLVPAAGGPPVPLLSTKFNETNGQISPDGKWVAYASDESGNWEVYVTSFPEAAGKWQVSRGGGGEPRWRADGKEIFYIAPSGMLMAVSVSSDSSFSTAAPAPLFQIHGRAPISSTDAFTYDVAKDGERFLVNRYVSPEHVPPLTILLQGAVGSPSH